MVDSPAPAVLKVSELAALLRMGQRQVREGVIRGDIPCHKIGGQIRCSKVAIDRWLNGEEGGDRHDVGQHASGVRLEVMAAD